MECEHRLGIVACLEFVFAQWWCATIILFLWIQFLWERSGWVGGSAQRRCLTFYGQRANLKFFLKSNVIFFSHFHTLSLSHTHTLSNAASVKDSESREFSWLSELKGHSGAVYCVQYSPCGRYLASGIVSEASLVHYILSSWRHSLVLHANTHMNSNYITYSWALKLNTYWYPHPDSRLIWQDSPSLGCNPTTRG